MAAAGTDPRFDVVFSLGNPTAANLTATRGEPLLDLLAQHWLVTVCSGDLMPSPNGLHLKSITWRELEVVVYKIFFKDAAINAVDIAVHTVTTATISGMFRMAHAGGLSSSPQANKAAALAELVRVALPLAQASKAAWTLGAASLQPLPPHQGAAVPVGQRWALEVKIGMLSTMDDAPRGAVLWCAMSPARIPTGRRQVEYTDVIDELSELAETTRPGWVNKSEDLRPLVSHQS